MINGVTYNVAFEEHAHAVASASRDNIIRAVFLNILADGRAMGRIISVQSSHALKLSRI